MRVGSLFAGIGGLDLGLERARMTVVWQCEIDTACQTVLRRRFPHATVYGDIKTLGGDVDPVDLVCGGFPSQSSTAPSHAGLAGERSGLFYEFMRVVDALSPTWILIENVPGLLSSNGGRDMGAVLGTLGELGYGYAYRVLDAQYFGVAQRRRRVFIIGCLGDGRRAAEVLLEPDCLPGDSPPRREAGADAARRPAGCTGDGVQADRGVVSSLTQALGRGGPDAARAQAGWLVAHALTAAHGSTEDGTGRGVPIVMAPSFSKRPGQQIATRDDGLSYALTAGEPPRVLSVAQNQRGELRTGNIAPALGCGGGKPGSGYPCVAFAERTRPQGRTLEISDDLAYCLANPGGGGRAHSRSIVQGMAVRRLTPLECERLQGFPDGWTEGQSDSTRYRQLGNAVCVPVAEWIGRRIMEVTSYERR